MEREIKKHIGEERLEAYSARALAGEELARVEEHLLFCEICQDQLEPVERYVQAMRSAAMRIRKEEGEGRALSGGWRWLGWVPHVPIPIWCGAVAMAVLFLVVSLQLHQRPGAGVDVELQAMRGESTATVQAGHSLRLHLDHHGLQDLPSWRIEIVDSEGSRVWTGVGNWSDTAITAVVPKPFTAGTYYVRILLKEKEDPVREYQLVVK